MVTKIITNEHGEPLYKEVTPSEGNALFCQGMEEIEVPRRPGARRSAATAGGQWRAAQSARCARLRAGCCRGWRP